VTVRKPQRLPLKELAPYLLEVSPTPTVFDWTAVFGNADPVELEVGFGKGTFLLAAAQAHPGVNYVGVEIDRGLQLYVATRMAKRGLSNVRLIQGDARLIVRDYIAAESLRAVHVYFPDPWWKKRHKKRRVFTAEFAAQCERLLVPGGRLHLATDVEEYASVMTQLLADHTKLCRLPEVPQDVASVTNFERKAKEQGRGVWRAVYATPPALRG
jgi:tRNA (guanine-N7-)-methyltransferase